MNSYTALIMICLLLLSPVVMYGEETGASGCLSRILKCMDVVQLGDDSTYVFYGDEGGHLHILLEKNGTLTEINEIGIPSAVVGLVAADIEGTGDLQLVIVTTDGQVAIHHGESLEALWRNQDQLYSSISAMAVAQVDQDPPLEILLIADEHLVIYDGSTRFKEWTSPNEMAASDLLVADVDGDDEAEIVLSSGVILSTVFFQVEWEAGEPFGKELFLFDLDNDGIPEIIAKQENGTIRIYNAREQRERW